MPRKARSYKKHKIDPDPKYNNVKVAKFINNIMERGKKTVAQKIVYEAFNYVKEKMSTEPRQVFDTALKNVSPILEVKSSRKLPSAARSYRAAQNHSRHALADQRGARAKRQAHAYQAWRRNYICLQR